MTSLTFTECCQRLSVTPKTLRQWLAQAEMSLHPHPTDARITCLTSEQLHLLATLHGRVLHPSGKLLVDDRLGPGEADAGLRTRVAQLEAQVTTLQTQLDYPDAPTAARAGATHRAASAGAGSRERVSRSLVSVVLRSFVSSAASASAACVRVPSYGEAQFSDPAD
jgi:hypothetical protein